MDQQPSYFRPHLLGPRRRLFQWLTTLIVIGLPWGNYAGHSLLRVDLEARSLYLFGQVLRIEELYLLLFFSLCLVLLFLLMTLVLGRVWCGWACPQTTLTDLAEWLAKRCGAPSRNHRLEGPLWRKTLLQLLYALLGLLVGANLVWYFIEPQRFFSELTSLTLQTAAWAGWLLSGATVYLDLALLRRLMCRDFCPYGRLQTTLVDPGTLTLRLPEDEKPRCIECGDCIRNCPMGIDIRRGDQVECINCGRCLDACRQVMARCGETGLISYRFGDTGRGPKALLHPRTLLLGVALIGMCVILLVAVWQRSDASLKVAMSYTAASRLLASGQQVTFYTAWVGNRSSHPLTFELTARDKASGAALELKGQTRELTLEGGKTRRIEFALLTHVARQRLEIEFALHDRQGTPRALAAASVLPPGTGEQP
ncbi:MAG: FeS-binding protein [Desulfuromonas sp.]|nr:MAG: FeS-binding protein [Desulfuromonas sp.]